MEIRPLAESDRPLLMDLAARAGKDALTGSLWGHPGSEAAVHLAPLGFQPHGSAPLVPGIRGLKGEKPHQLAMVRSA